MIKNVTVWAAILVLGLDPSAFAREVRVFILAGQSNMVGHGKPEYGRDPEGGKEIKGGLGSLRRFVKDNESIYGAGGTCPLVDADGAWIQREDVFIYSTTERGFQKGRLTTGFGKGNWIGPEFGFGHVMGNAVEDPVLIIKTAWGGKDLAVDFRPPSSGKETPLAKKRTPGAYYEKMIALAKEGLANMEEDFPELKGCKPRLAGFGWHQGWNDGCSDAMVEEYEANMANFIRDIRKDLGAKDLPFVIANSGMIGPEGKGRRAELCEIQLGMGDPEKHPEFKGTVACVETRDCYRSHLKSPSKFGYHWHHNGETHFLVGKKMAEALLALTGGE